MNKKEIMELVDKFGRLCVVRGWDTEEAVKVRAAIEAALPDVPTVPESVISGALFDFAGYLTTLDESVTFGAHENASPIIKHLQAWAKKRELSLNGADVLGWTAMLSAAPEPAQVSDKSSEAEQPRNEPVQQEPVTYSMTSNGKHTGNLYDNLEFAKERKAAMDMKWPDRVREIVPLYTSPQTQPMSDGQLNMFGHRIANQLGDVSPDRVQTIVRAVERFHKIGG